MPGVIHMDGYFIESNADLLDVPLKPHIPALDYTRGIGCNECGAVFSIKEHCGPVVCCLECGHANISPVRLSHDVDPWALPEGWVWMERNDFGDPELVAFLDCGDDLKDRMMWCKTQVFLNDEENLVHDLVRLRNNMAPILELPIDSCTATTVTFNAAHKYTTPRKAFV